MPELRIGTSGWSYDNWIGEFYPEGTDKGDMLAHYVRHYDTAEINATFYRLPFENMVKGWKNKTPDDFSYSVKGSRRITHYNKLEDIEEYLERFLDRVCALGDCLNTIFWQFPPSFKKHAGRLKRFLSMLPDQPRFAFEFRDTSWLDDEIYGLLEEHGAAPVWVSSGKMPDDCTPTTDFAYVRFHGLEGGYTYSYHREDLEPWAAVARKQLKEGRDLYLYFNNTGGNAPEAAEMMRKMLEDDE